MSICDNMPKIPLPRYLREHGDEIQHIFDNAGKNADTWHYDASVWQKEFKDNSEVSDDLSEITKKYPDRITRSHVQSYARKIRPGSYQGIRRLFLACMIWGYGPDPNGQANTKLALSAPRLKAVLEKSVERIKNTQIKKAYEGFELAGCGPAFFTKFFYFVGHEYHIKPLPLILDSHVANFLRFLGSGEGWGLSLFAKTGLKGYIKRYSKGYMQYICSMDNWAKELGCYAADNIEYFMYKKDKELEKALGEVDGEGNPEVPIIFHRDGAYCLKCGAFLTSPEPGVGFTLDKIKGIVWRHGCYDC